MARLRKFLFILAFLFSGIYTCSAFAEGPKDDPPPPPGGGHGGGGNQMGAPIDGGLSILLVLSACYGGRKLYKAKNQARQDILPEE
jgi:hypothetical protein